MVGMAATWALAVWLGPVSGVAQEPHGPVAPAGVPPDDLFQTSSDCLACHNGLTTPAGEDVSIGVQWRTSMMANSSRDPYWHAAVRRETIDHPEHAAVRRETIDHPEHAAAIEDECSICHMPMARTRAGALGLEGRVFANQRWSGGGDTLEAQLAADGVSCTVCHQISDERLGTPESFGGGFVMAAAAADGSRSIAGPFEVNDGHTALMRSATGAQPTEAAHIRQSELCATCHTLTTEAFDADGNVVGSLNRCPTRNGSTAPSSPRKWAASRATCRRSGQGEGRGGRKKPIRDGVRPASVSLCPT